MASAGALLTAAVGDALFASTIHELAVTDYAQRHGLSTQLVRIAGRNAAMARSSVWTLVRHAIRDGILNRKQFSEENPCELRTLVNDAVRERVRGQLASSHPWFTPTEGVPPGKLLHMQLALNGEARFYDPLMPENGPEELEPLASQPVIEAALRIPTYTLVNDGRNRGLARQAFVNDVPAPILARTWKGRPGNTFDRHFQSNIRFIRELLLDGVLVRERLLDRRKLLTTLNGPTKQEGGLMEIFDHLITESWLRRWTDPRAT
jgi:asparagine synthase (glutamine-hydrolysing)